MRYQVDFVCAGFSLMSSVYSPTQFHVAPIELNDAPIRFDGSPIELQDARTQFDGSPFELDHAPKQLFHAPIQMRHAPTELRGSLVSLPDRFTDHGQKLFRCTARWLVGAMYQMRRETKTSVISERYFNQFAVREIVANQVFRHPAIPQTHD